MSITVKIVMLDRHNKCREKGKRRGRQRRREGKPLWLFSVMFTECTQV